MFVRIVALPVARRRAPQGLLALFFVLGLVLLMAGFSSCASNAGVFAGDWQAIGLQTEHIKALAVDPNNLQHIYAGDAQDGVFASANTGINWVRSDRGLPASSSIFALSFDIPGKKLYAATSAGLYDSADAGQNWQIVSGLPADPFTALAFDLNSPQVIYAGTSRAGIFKSTNGGVSWTAVGVTQFKQTPVNGLSVDSSTHRVWASTSVGIYRSDNGGADWQLMSNGIPQGDSINTVFSPIVVGGAQDVVFAGTTHGFFRSTDGGQHWAASQTSLAGLNIAAIIQDYSLPATIYAASSIGVLRSVDNGQNWDLLASGIPKGQAVNALAQGSPNYAQLFAAAHGIFVYPGSDTFSPSRLAPVIPILLLFVLLYFMIMRRNRRVREAVQRDRGAESPDPTP